MKIVITETETETRDTRSYGSIAKVEVTTIERVEVNARMAKLALVHDDSSGGISHYINLSAWDISSMEDDCIKYLYEKEIKRNDEADIPEMFGADDEDESYTYYEDLLIDIDGEYHGPYESEYIELEHLPKFRAMVMCAGHQSIEGIYEEGLYEFAKKNMKLIDCFIVVDEDGKDIDAVFEYPGRSIEVISE